MDAIIKTLTGNVDTNDDLVKQVLALIKDLKDQKAEQQALQAQIGNVAGLQIAELQERITTLEKELEAYRKRVEDANAKLVTSIGKMQAEIGARQAPPAPPADGKRRSRKRNSRKRKSKRSKKRHY